MRVNTHPEPEPEAGSMQPPCCLFDSKPNAEKQSSSRGTGQQVVHSLATGQMLYLSVSSCRWGCGRLIWLWSDLTSDPSNAGRGAKRERS